MSRKAYRHTRFEREVPLYINDISNDFKEFIDDKTNEELKIYVTRQLDLSATKSRKSDYLGLVIQYKISNNDIVKLLCMHRINNLPRVFNNHILDYICDTPPGWTRSSWTGRRWIPIPRPTIYINIDIKIEYKSDYPFKAPVYSLVNTKTNASNKLYIKHFIESKVFHYNDCWNYTGNWSPAYGIKKDIMCFMVYLKRLKNMINNYLLHFFL